MVTIGHHTNAAPHIEPLAQVHRMAVHGSSAAPDVPSSSGSYLPTQNRDARAEYVAAHYSVRCCFDINARSPIIRPSCPACAGASDQFGAAARSSNFRTEGYDRRYGQHWLYSAPRVWCGHSVSSARATSTISDGGLACRLGRRRPADRSGHRPASEKLTPKWIRRRGDAHRRADGAQRSKRAGDRRAPPALAPGREPEPRAGLRSGR